MRQALGKGIDALIPSSLPGDPDGQRGERLISLSLDQIRPNRRQPRSSFRDESLNELAQSIREHGLAQPVLVVEEEGYFELIAGERRYRAAKLAGLTSIPAMVRPAPTDKQRLTLALIENLQREGLQPIETAEAYRKLMVDFGLSQTQVAEAMGKSRPAVANTLRLLELPEQMKEAVADGRLSEGQGRALLSVADARRREALFNQALQEGLSVRELEALSREGSKADKTARPKTDAPLEVRNLALDLQRRLGTKVSVTCSKKGVGALRIEFYSLDDLARLAGSIK